MATINTTTINGVPEVNTELTGDENILIQQAPNSNIMGKRTLNNLKSFFGEASNSGGNINTTSLENSSQNDILYISGGEYATEEIFNKLYDINNNEIVNSITTEAFTNTYKTKTTEQLYIHFICDAPDINNKSGAIIEIQTKLNTNKNGEANWVPICKTSASQKSICSHIIIEGGLEIRGRIFIGTAQSLSLNSTVSVSLSITSMSNDSFGKYDETKCIYTSIEKGNRYCDFKLITDENGVKKPVYSLDIYAKGGVKKAMTLSTLITVDSNEMKYGRIISYPTTPINQHLGTYLFNKDCSVDVDYSGTLQPGGYLEVKYKTDQDNMVSGDEKLPTIEQFDDNIYNLSSSMKIETADTFNFDSITTNNNQISVVTEYDGKPQKIYALLDSSIMMDDTPGKKTIYIYDDINSCKLQTYGSKITKIRFNHSIKSIPEKCMYKSVTELLEIDLKNTLVEEICDYSFGTHNTKQQKLTEINLPITLSSIGQYAFGDSYTTNGGYKNINLLSIPYTTKLGKACFNGLTFQGGNANVTEKNIHLKLTKENYLDNGNVSLIVIKDNLLTTAGKEQLNTFRSRFSGLPSTLYVLLCDENGQPLVYIVEGKNRNLIVQIPSTMDGSWVVTDINPL